MKKFIGALVAVGLAATAYSAEAKPHKVKKSKHKPHKVVKLHKKHKVKKHPRIKKHVKHHVVKHHLAKHHVIKHHLKKHVKQHVKNIHQKVVKEEVNVSPNSEVDMLALAIHNEARGEPRSGKYAVANVILNRVKHKSFLILSVKSLHNADNFNGTITTSCVLEQHLLKKLVLLHVTSIRNMYRVVV